ncbi:MAG: metal-dependent transcriptional regulator [Chloroflexi bacterium]|nr:metal-dependent transcriptional regulator [Chloroflexota bacterium]
MPKIFSRNPQSAPRAEIQEMILLTLARSAENANAVSPADLAHELNLSRPALDTQLRPLVEQGLLSGGASGTLALTESGRERAHTLLRRHRLTERLFTDVLGLDLVRAHEEADKFEHVVSPEAERQLASQLGDPETCPHGNPIPNAYGAATHPSAVPLDQCAPRAHATIVRIAQETPVALQHLATLGLLPNVQIQVENKAPFDGPVLVRVGRAHYALGHDLAARIWVRLEN